jgi:hypothetical protein
MVVFVASHTVYHSRLLSLHFCFVLEFKICHRIGWNYPRFVCCSKCSFLCSALRIIATFFSLGHWIVCTRFALPWSICPLTFPNFGHCIVCSSICDFCFLLISPDYSFDIFLFSPFVPSDRPFDVFYLPLWFFSDYALDIFRSLRVYLLITPLVSSDYDFGIFWLPPLVSSDKLIVFFWLTHCYFQCFVRNSLRLPIISDLLAKL